jgi:hypothetical protein
MWGIFCSRRSAPMTLVLNSSGPVTLVRGAAAVIDVGLGHPIPQTRLRDPQLLGQLGWSSIDPDCRPARRQELDLRTRRGIGPVSAARPGRRLFGLAGPANVIHASARNSREVPGQEES